MNNKIRKQDLEKILIFDAELVSRNKELIIDSKEYELFQWKHRDKVKDEFLTDEELKDLYKRKAALDPVFNKIVCISLGYVKGDTFFYKSLVGEQKDIIEEFYNILNMENFIPCGYNIIGFDIPTIRMKAFEAGCEVELLDKFSDSGRKPWDLDASFIDLMNVIKGTYFYNLSLDDACFLAGVESPKGNMKGSEVSKAYHYEDRLDDIVKYCEEDVIACIRLFCALQGNKDYIKNFVSKNEVIVEKLSPLERLYNTNQFSKDIQDELREQFSKKKILKKDKTEIFNIIRGVYVRTNFEAMDQDSKKIIEKKEKEINDFLETL